MLLRHEKIFNLIGGECNQDKIDCTHLLPPSDKALRLRKNAAIKRIHPNEAFFLGSALMEERGKGRMSWIEKLNALYNGVQDTSCISNKEMIIAQAGHFFPSIGHSLFTGDLTNGMLKWERRVRTTMKAKMGHSKSFPFLWHS